MFKVPRPSCWWSCTINKFHGDHKYADGEFPATDREGGAGWGEWRMNEVLLLLLLLVVVVVVVVCVCVCVYVCMCVCVCVCMRARIYVFNEKGAYRLMLTQFLFTWLKFQVILFVPDYFRARRCTEPPPPGATADIEVRIFDTGDDDDANDNIEDKLKKLGDEVMRGGTGLLGASSEARKVTRDVCSSYMEARDDLDALRREGKVDLVVVDGSPTAHCLTLLPAYLGSPFVAVSSYIDPFDSAVPLPINFYPAPLSGLPGNMGFFQRLTNFFYYASYSGADLFGGFHQGSALGERVSRLEQDKLIKKALLYLENSDYIIDYPKAIFPNFVQVGGLTASPARPLPGPLAKFFDAGADTGVIVVSLGPSVFTPNKNLEDKLLSAFRQVDARVLLRLNASRSVNKIKNVQTVSWFPQNDALGHPNTRLFMSNCGKNSFFEALFHGVPLLCCNFAGSDVLGTGARVAEYGVGLSLDLMSANPNTIAATITTLLTDKAYARRIKAASKLFHSRSHTPAQRAANAIENVLKYGGGYLRPRNVDMSFFQYAGLDVALTLFAIILAVVGVLLFLVLTHLLPKRQSREVTENSAEANVEATVKKQAPEESNPFTQIIMYTFFVLLILFYVFFWFPCSTIPCCDDVKQSTSLPTEYSCTDSYTAEFFKNLHLWNCTGSFLYPSFNFGCVFS